MKSAIMPALLEALSNAIDTDDVVAKIKECKNLAEKVQLWNQLKEMAFGKALLFLYAAAVAYTRQSQRILRGDQ